MIRLIDITGHQVNPNIITILKKRDDRVEKSGRKKGIGLTMLITTLLRSIPFYIVTEHYHPNTQCRIGLISELIPLVH